MLRDHAWEISLQLVACDSECEDAHASFQSLRASWFRYYTVIPAISFIEAAVNSRFMRLMKAAGTLAGHTASQA